MARFDPREKELDRVQGWYRQTWIEFILTKSQMIWTITVLLDGELFGTFDQDTEAEVLVGIIQAEERICGTFGSLVERFLQREAA